MHIGSTWLEATLQDEYLEQNTEAAEWVTQSNEPTDTMLEHYTWNIRLGCWELD